MPNLTPSISIFISLRSKHVNFAQCASCSTRQLWRWLLTLKLITKLWFLTSWESQPCIGTFAVGKAPRKTSNPTLIRTTAHFPLTVTLENPETRFGYRTNILAAVEHNSIKLAFYCEPACSTRRTNCFMDYTAFDVIFDQIYSSCFNRAISEQHLPRRHQNQDQHINIFVIGALTENICPWLQQL